MARVNLSIEDELFQRIEKDATEHNCTVNVHIISILEGLYKQYPFNSQSLGLINQLYEQNPFNYQDALQELINDIEMLKDGTEFTLVDLPSFSKICMAKAKDANIKPAIVRARLGKMFNSAVAKAGRTDDKNVIIKGVKRQKVVKNGVEELKFVCRTAVYVVDRTENSVDEQNPSNEEN